MKTSIYISFVLLLLSAFNGHAEPLDPSRVKALFVYPFSSAKTLKGSWIEIITCRKPDAQCDQTIGRIPLREIKVNGKFLLNIDPLGSLELRLQTTKDQDPIKITKQIYEEHWFKKGELCTGAQREMGCHYRLLRDTDSQSLVLEMQLKPLK